MCRTRFEPASSCSGSTFWVTRKRPSPRNPSSSARARCAGFGFTSPICLRRSEESRQTGRGSRAKPSAVATSSTRCWYQSPPASRKVATPLSALMPAPVSTKTRLSRFTAMGSNSPLGPTRDIPGTSEQQALRARRSRATIVAMQGTDLRSELSRRYFVKSRTARTAAIRMAYIAYARTVAGWQLRRPTTEARASLRRRIEELFDRDWQDAADGLYPRELIEGLPWREYALAAPKLIADLPKTRERIRTGRHDELPEQADRYPRYYARNFHYQTDGYLGHTSAELYDLQVELIFGGTADAMRRRLVPPVVRYSRAHGYGSARPMKLLDVACGTGHLLRMMGKALPDARLFGLDLSPQYIARARETLPREMDVSLVCDDAEKLPFVDGHFDAATNLYLLHEV